jgi:hypothetical protein
LVTQFTPSVKGARKSFRVVALQKPSSLRAIYWSNSSPHVMMPVAIELQTVMAKEEI